MLKQLTEDCEKTLMRAEVQIESVLYKKIYKSPYIIELLNHMSQGFNFTTFAAMSRLSCPPPFRRFGQQC